MLRPVLSFACAMLMLACVARGAELPPAAKGQVDFAHQIVPLLKKHCGQCHAGEKRKGGFSINTREAMLSHGEKVKSVVPGDSGESELLWLLVEEDDELRMPQDAEPLTREEIGLIRAWIDQGAAWADGFTFGADGYAPRDGRTNPIDRIIDAYLAERGAERPGPIDDAAFMRRVYFDVIGLPPTPGELEAFVKDNAPDKRARMIDAVLAHDRAYAEHWLTFWNDLLRNDYRGTGYIDGGRKQITKWLYASLLSNKPYDQFVRELISPTGESEGFIRGIKWRGRVNASQTREIQFSQNVSQVFLGINMKCASCHDSFIDDWKLDDAYALAAIVSDKPLEIYRCDKPTGEMAEARFLWPELGELDAGAPRGERLARMAELLTSPDNGRLTRTIVNRLWHRMMGRGIVHPVDAMSRRPWNEDLLDYLAVHLAESGYDLKATIRLIATSQAYQSRSEVRAERPEGEYVYLGPVARRLTAEQMLDAVWSITGTGPRKIEAPIKRPGASGEGSDLIRAALVTSDPLMRSLGRPNREQVVTTRPDELTTLQALDLTNGPEFSAMLSEGAKRLMSGGDEAGALIEYVYRYALSRGPTAQERALALEIVGEPMREEGVADLLWVVLMSPEFQLIR